MTEITRTSTTAKRPRPVFIGGSLRSLPLPRDGGEGFRREGPLLVEPEPRDGRRAITVRAPERGCGHVPDVRLESEEAVVVRHPHSQDLIELPIDDLLGVHTLLRQSRELP